MRPLIHLGIGAASKDYHLHAMSMGVYDELMEEGMTRIENAYKEHMGEYYKEPPLTWAELKSSYDEHINRLAGMKRCRVPDIIIENEVARIKQMEERLKGGLFADAKDEDRIAYCKRREELLEEWDVSEIYESLYNEICEHNEAVYEDLVKRTGYTYEKFMEEGKL